MPKESHFAKAANILSSAQRGERIARPSGVEWAAIPRPQSTGDPGALTRAYTELLVRTDALLECPNSHLGDRVHAQLRECARLEPLCAPPKSPWARPALGEDTTIFTKHRRAAELIRTLVIINRHTDNSRWVGRAALVRNIIKETRISQFNHR